MSETFLKAEEHSKALVEDLEPLERETYDECKHTRIETAYRGRQFIIYEMNDPDTPQVLDRITFLDFECNDVEGSTSKIRSATFNETLILDYIPQSLFGWSVMMWLPQHAKLRWSVPPSDIYKGSLGFPVCVRTQSRLHLREIGVTYCESGPQFGEEFGNNAGG